MKEAVSYLLWFHSYEVKGRNQNKYIKVQACTEKEACHLGRSMNAKFHPYEFFRAERLGP